MRDPDGAWPECFLSARGIEDPGAPALIDLLLEGETRREIPVTDPKMLKQRTLAMARQVLLSSRSAAASVLVIEDLHWIDPTSLELVTRLVHAARDSRTLMLLTYRPVFTHDWMGQSHVHLLALNRMNNTQCEEMIAGLLGGTAISDNIKAEVVEKTDGIPLYIEEVVRTLEDSAGGTSGFRDLVVPATLTESLNARLDDIGDARRTAQAASVIGREFEIGLLSAVANRERPTIVSDVDSLVDAGLVLEFPDGKENRYQFKHALIQDAAYGSLLKSRRSRFHERAADFLLRSTRNPERLYGTVAHHLTMASSFDRALEFSTLAGESALKSMGVNEARDHFTRAESISEKVSDRDKVTVYAIRIHTGLAACFRLQENYEQALAHLDMAERMATSVGSLHSLSDICNARANIHFTLGDAETIMREQNRALGYARELGSRELEIRSIGGLGDAYYARGEMGKAKDHFELCCGMAGENGFDGLDAAHRAMIGWSRIYQLEMVEARDNACEAIEVARSCNHLRGEMNAHSLLGFVYSELMEWELGRKHGRMAIEIAERLGSYNFRAAHLIFSNRSMDEVADRETMFAMASEAADTCRKYGLGFHGPAVLGGLMLVSDDPDQRRALAVEAEQVIEKGSVAHNYFWYFQFALQTALNNREWQNLERFRKGLTRMRWTFPHSLVRVLHRTFVDPGELLP